MQSGSHRATRGVPARRVQGTRRSIGGAIFCLPTCPFAHGVMIAPQPNVLEQTSDRREVMRPSAARVRSWTGRSSVACATDSHLSTLATAGTRVTRVSAVRFLPVRADRIALQGARVGTGQASSPRRMDPRPPIEIG